MWSTTAIDDEYGTNEDFQRLMEEAHKRGIRVIVDLVMNHTSAQHPWFLESSNPIRLSATGTSGLQMRPARVGTAGDMTRSITATSAITCPT